MPYNRPLPDSTRTRREQRAGDGETTPPRRTSSGIETLVQAEKLMQIAILLPSAAFIGWLLGAWADKALHQSWISLAGMLFGGVSGLVYVVRLVISTGAESGSGKRSGGSRP